MGVNGVRWKPGTCCGHSAATLRRRAVPGALPVRQPSGMLNERLDTIRIAGCDALQIRFDLGDAELLAVARSVAGVATERYRGVALDADGVLELRELTAIHDAALERAEDGYAGGTLVVSVNRLGVMIEALGEWITQRYQAGFMRAHEAQDLPAVEGLMDDLRDLHMRGLRTALAALELEPAGS